jgi:predicted pyridoxine 5'-phosphate oxidase superfamily flavin-nucleotide-binding protein
VDDDNGFHSGERAMQRKAGETAIADHNSGVLSGTVIAGARPFIARQFMVALASIAPAGEVWSSVVFGKPGFLHADGGSSLAIDVPEKERDRADPLWNNLADGHDLGMLFIELGSRRRYRVNGTVGRLNARGVEVDVREAFGNCPKYIQRRQLRKLGEPALPVQAARGRALRGAVASIVAQADTIFVASHHEQRGADASHRGGGAGFVRLIDDTTLRIPDFQGNSLFNTLGNFYVDPRAGLCIPDFLHGQLLQLTGAVSIRWDEDDPANETGGTRRFWEFRVSEWILRDIPQRLEWEYLDASPFNPSI